NQYRADQDNAFEIREVDNDAVMRSQVERLASLRRERNGQDVEIALMNISHAAKSGEGNLLALAIEAARKRATLGEITEAMEKIFRRHKASGKSVSGIYSRTAKDESSFKQAGKLADQFAELEGRRPRILVAKMGQDGHDRGAKVIATGFADLGFDVYFGPLFQTPMV